MYSMCVGKQVFGALTERERDLFEVDLFVERGEKVRCRKKF